MMRKCYCFVLGSFSALAAESKQAFFSQKKLFRGQFFFKIEFQQRLGFVAVYYDVEIAE